MTGWRAAVAALLFATPRFLIAADDLSSAARELARKTAAWNSSHNPVSLAYRNLSSLGNADLSQARYEFEAALPAGTEPGPPIEGQLTLSENASDYLLVEEVHRGDESQVWFARWKRADQPAKLSAISIEKRFVWEDAEPILDIAFPAGAMTVLTASRVSLYTREAGKWRAGQTKALAPTQPWPRDLRGRLRLNGDRLQALLPGMQCSGTASLSSFECHNTTEAWVLDSGRGLLLANFVPGRNYFDGRLALQNGANKTVGPFYSAAAIDEGGTISWLLAMLDGHTQIFDSAFREAGRITGWGSDIAATGARCAEEPQVLAAGAGDSEPDTVQAYSIGNGSAAPLGSAVAFPGPVTALWPSAPGSAVAVARDLVTGKYMAYVLTVVCGP